MKLSELQVKEFVDLLASEAAAPGGGFSSGFGRGSWCGTCSHGM